MSDEFNGVLSTDKYGNFELGNIAASGVTHEESRVDVADWTDKRIAKVERFRVIIGVGHPFYSVSYVYVILKDGTKGKLLTPPWLRNYGNSEAAVKRAIVEAGKRDKVFAKGLGVFETLSILFD